MTETRECFVGSFEEEEDPFDPVDKKAAKLGLTDCADDGEEEE